MIARVRPVTKEDGEGPEATNAVTFDPDDDSIIHLLHKGKPVSFELDKVFSPWASQQDVSVGPGGRWPQAWKVDRNPLRQACWDQLEQKAVFEVGALCLGGDSRPQSLP